MAKEQFSASQARQVDDPSATGKVADQEANDETHFITGIKLYLLVAGMTLIAFLVLLDISIMATVSSTIALAYSSKRSVTRKFIYLMFNRPFRRSRHNFTRWKMLVGTVERINSAGKLATLLSLATSSDYVVMLSIFC